MLTASDEEEEEEGRGDRVEKVTSLKIWSAKQIWRCTFRSAYRSTTSPRRLATVSIRNLRAKFMPSVTTTIGMGSRSWKVLKTFLFGGVYSGINPGAKFIYCYYVCYYVNKAVDGIRPSRNYIVLFLKNETFIWPGLLFRDLLQR